MSITTSRLVAPLALLALSPLLTWCSRAPEAPASQTAPADTAPPAPAPPTVVMASDLNRAAVLAALTEAGSALADGRALDAALTGRTVSVRLPIGCEGPTAQAAPGLPRLIRNSDQTLTLSITPQDLKGSVLTPANVSGERWDAVEGFWIARPWSQTDACPPAPAASPTAGADDLEPTQERTAGLAAVFETGGSRLGRRQGQAYAHVIRGEKNAAPQAPAAGYALRLEGRLTAFADGRAVHCRQADPDQRPVCIAALRLDRLAFEDGATGAVLSEWRPH